MALWLGYGAGPYGVVVNSTFGTLDQVLPAKFRDLIGRKEPDMDCIFLGRVNYLDYSSEAECVPYDGNIYAPFVCKSVAYQHESEVRALFIDPLDLQTEDRPSGHFIRVDLPHLIQRVVVSPLAPDWFEAVVRSMIEKYGYDFPISRSVVIGEPIF